MKQNPRKDKFRRILLLSISRGKNTREHNKSKYRATIQVIPLQQTKLMKIILDESETRHQLIREDCL
jgi:hypothetical protein